MGPQGRRRSNLDIQFLPLDLATGRIVIRLRDQKQDGEAAQ